MTINNKSNYSNDNNHKTPTPTKTTYGFFSFFPSIFFTVFSSLLDAPEIELQRLLIHWASSNAILHCTFKCNYAFLQEVVSVRRSVRWSVRLSVRRSRVIFK